MPNQQPTVQSPGFSRSFAKEPQREVKAFQFAEPALGRGANTAVEQVGFKFVEAGQHVWVDAQHRAAQAGFAAPWKSAHRSVIEMRTRLMIGHRRRVVRRRRGRAGR
jgi:hypothetical protein